MTSVKSNQKDSKKIDYDLQELAQRREDEILALEAILPPEHINIRNVQDDDGKNSTLILFTIPISLPKPVKVRIRSHTFTSSSSTSGQVNDGVEILLFSSLSVKEGSQTRTKDIPRNIKSEVKLSTPCHIKDTTLNNILHLPPIKILVKLPKEYPEVTPEIQSISSDFIGKLSHSHEKISQRDISFTTVSSKAASYRFKLIQWIRSKLKQSWEEMPGEILYFWYDILRESLWTDNDSILIDERMKDGIVLDEFIIGNDGNRSSESSGLAAIIRSHDLICKRKEFEGERYGCGICLEDIRGIKCWKLSCNHVFCQHCLSEYVSRSILDGYPRQATACPDPECVKTRVQAENVADVANVQNEISSDSLSVQVLSSQTKQSQQQKEAGVITEEEIVSLVGKQLLDRLHELQEKALALRDPSFGFCPRPGCEHLVRGDPKDKGTAYEAMRQCLECSYTYCVYCSKAWHYGNPCNIVSSTALIEAYQNTEQGSMERKTMEMKYGKSNLERMVRTYEEEKSNREWIEANTQKCPCCHVNITKSFGCNHMACKACNTHFCYRCGTRLPANEPYRHFNMPGMPCYMKLFDADMTQGGAGGGWEFVDGLEEDQEAWERENF